MHAGLSRSRFFWPLCMLRMRSCAVLCGSGCPVHSLCFLRPPQSVSCGYFGGIYLLWSDSERRIFVRNLYMLNLRAYSSDDIFRTQSVMTTIATELWFVSFASDINLTRLLQLKHILSSTWLTSYTPNPALSLRDYSRFRKGVCWPE